MPATYHIATKLEHINCTLDELNKTLKHMTRLMEMHVLESNSKGKSMVSINSLIKKIMSLREDEK